MIECPKCGHDLSRVMDSRSTKKERAIRRRRKCDACGENFTTKEIGVLSFRKMSKQSAAFEQLSKFMRIQEKLLE